MSTYGKIFRVTTFGESHGVAVGCVIDGVPSRLEINSDDIQVWLDRRKPNQSDLTSPRKEGDKVEIISGIEGGKTLGTPICMIVRNNDIDYHSYKQTSNIPRPGHADYTYQMKYQIRSSSGGGRSSARETIGRVMAGAVASKWLYNTYLTTFHSWVSSVGPISIPSDINNKFVKYPPSLKYIEKHGSFYCTQAGLLIDRFQNVYNIKDGQQCVGQSVPFYPQKFPLKTNCPHGPTAAQMISYILKLRDQGDTTGGVITCSINNPPVGIGEPIFDKLEAELSKAMLSIPSTKGFEIGEGFEGTHMCGSTHNDLFYNKSRSNNLLLLSTNHAGGTLGGISNGEKIVFKVAFKPLSSIKILQKTCNFDGNMMDLNIEGRHDPCVVTRAIPIVDAMASLVIIDATLQQRTRQFELHTLSNYIDDDETTLSDGSVISSN